jgi:ammonium transporter, Amt family
MVIGVAAGVLCYAAVTWLKALFGYDDALDCFGVHAIGGATGAILTGCSQSRSMEARRGSSKATPTKL